MWIFFRFFFESIHIIKLSECKLSIEIIQDQSVIPLKFSFKLNLVNLFSAGELYLC